MSVTNTNAVSNNGLLYLDHISTPPNSPRDDSQTTTNNLLASIGPAYTVEISAKARQLQQSQGVASLVVQ